MLFRTVLIKTLEWQDNSKAVWFTFFVPTFRLFINIDMKFCWNKIFSHFEFDTKARADGNGPWGVTFPISFFVFFSFRTVVCAQKKNSFLKVSWINIEILISIKCVSGDTKPKIRASDCMQRNILRLKANLNNTRIRTDHCNDKCTVKFNCSFCLKWSNVDYFSCMLCRHVQNFCVIFFLSPRISVSIHCTTRM